MQYQAAIKGVEGYRTNKIRISAEYFENLLNQQCDENKSEMNSNKSVVMQIYGP
jgi:hypothetical protein